MNFTEAKLLLDVLKMSRDLPKLKPLHDAAMEELEHMADDAQKAQLQKVSTKVKETKHG
jgi:hypothetical protein